MPYFTASDGARLHYRDEGSGPAIVFLHGWMMSSEFWRRQLDALSPRRRCLAPDLRGCGASETRPGTHVMDRLADDVHELLSHAGLDDVTLVGWSMGGGLTMRYIDRHGADRLRSVCLIDFPPHFEEDPQVTQKVCAKVRQDRRAFLVPFLKRMFAQPLEPKDEAWILREIERCKVETAVEMYTQLGVGDARGQRLDLPALLVFPEQGWYARSVETWKTIFPRHEVPTFRASRHAPFLEEPERFNEVLGRFTEA